MINLHRVILQRFRGLVNPPLLSKYYKTLQGSPRRAYRRFIECPTVDTERFALYLITTIPDPPATSSLLPPAPPMMVESSCYATTINFISSSSSLTTLTRTITTTTSTTCSTSSCNWILLLELILQPPPKSEPFSGLSPVTIRVASVVVVVKAPVLHIPSLKLSLPWSLLTIYDNEVYKFICSRTTIRCYI